MSEIYGALRIVQVHPPANATATAKGSDAINWLPEKELVHMLTRRETTIGRALSNDIVLLDSAVSREHVCLVLDQCGWHVRNLSTQNSVCVNGQPVPGGNGLPVQPLDMLLLGSTRLQLIAPQSTIADGSPHPGDEATPLYAERYTMEQNRHCASADGGQGELARRDPAFDEGRQAQMQPLTWS